MRKWVRLVEFHPNFTMGRIISEGESFFFFENKVRQRKL